MAFVLLGLLLIFFQPNLDFVDIGVTYYITNIIGYISLFFGIKELGSVNREFNKIQPIIIIMIVHSTLFFLLNITGNSPVTIAMSTPLMSFLSFAGLIVIIAGKFMVFYIIHQFFKSLNDVENKQISSKLSVFSYLYKSIVGLFIVTSLCFLFFPAIVKFLIGALLILKILFLLNFYRAFLLKNQNHQTSLTNSMK